MNTKSTLLVNDRNIYIRSEGALNGDILTVATVVLWDDTRQPVEKLSVSEVFVAGNHLPAGVMRSTNQFYDVKSGTYWFDIKVNPLKGPVDFILQTDAFINDVQVPIRFNVPMNGPSPIVVSPITFEGDVLNFQVSAAQGKLLRYPLGLIAQYGITGIVKTTPVKDPIVPYAFRVEIENDNEFDYIIMGTADVDSVKHNWTLRTHVVTNTGTVVTKQIGKNLLSVVATLKTPNPDIQIDYPIHFNFENGTIGVTNQVDNFKVTGNEVYFELPIGKVVGKEKVFIDFTLSDPNNNNLPIFFNSQADVKLWNDGETEITVSVVSHTFKNNVEYLELNTFWKNGTPANDLKLVDLPNGAEYGIEDNRYIIAKSVTVNANSETRLVLSGKFDLSDYDVSTTVPFSEDLIVGSSVIPMKLMSGLGTVDEDKVNIFLSVRQNNGDIFSDVKVVKFNGVENITVQGYDKQNGVVSFTAPTTSIYVYQNRSNVAISFEGDSEDQTYAFNFTGTLKVDVPYKVIASQPTWRYTLNPVTNQIYLNISWELKGNDGNFPLTAYIAQLKLNSSAVIWNKNYNSANGLLQVAIPIDLQHNGSIFVEAIGSVTGLGSFVNLPPIVARYRTPGKATYTGNEFTADNKLKVFFDIQGWESKSPDEVQLDDNSWNKVTGVKLGKSYSEYDSKTGKLTVVFDLFDPDSKVFSAQTTMKFNAGDDTVYPISFSFNK